MAELLTPGLHSGTLPKLYERLRRGAQREDDAARAAYAADSSVSDKAHGYRARFLEGIRQVETDVQRFVDREVLALLTRSAAWAHGCIVVEAIDCGSNRIRIRLACPGVSPDPCELAFEEQDGFILASMPVPGFVQALPQESGKALDLFENVLVGLYCFAGVDLVDAQIRRAIGERSTYGIADKHLVVWPDQDYRTELLYRIRATFSRNRIRPKIRGRQLHAKPPALERDQLFFDRKAANWQAWNEAWQNDPEAPVPKLLRGPSILPDAVIKRAATADN